jgi:hypothetical protein
LPLSCTETLGPHSARKCTPSTTASGVPEAQAKATQAAVRATLRARLSDHASGRAPNDAEARSFVPSRLPPPDPQPRQPARVPTHVRPPSLRRKAEHPYPGRVGSSLRSSRARSPRSAPDWFRAQGSRARSIRQRIQQPEPAGTPGRPLVAGQEAVAGVREIASLDDAAPSGDRSQAPCRVVAGDSCGHSLRRERRPAYSSLSAELSSLSISSGRPRTGASLSNSANRATMGAS